MAVSPASGLRLLLVEDDPMVRDTIALMLEDEYEVIEAASAATALIVLDSQSASSLTVILLDCLLPAGNVSAVLSAARQRSIPVVLISGDPAQARAVDPDLAFLPKPFARERLLSVLDSARG